MSFDKLSYTRHATSTFDIDDAEIGARTFKLSRQLFDELLSESHPLLKTFDLRKNFLTDLQRGHLTAIAGALLQNVRFCELIASELDRSRSDASGYLILDFEDVVSDDLTVRDYAILTAACSVFGEPFGAFRKFGLWKPVGVDPSVDPWRAGGTGLNPLHIDFVNATLPPDFTCFFCVRDDPLGGGESVISNHLQILSMLTEKQKELAFSSAIYEGKFFDLVGIGTDLQPFPLFERRDDGAIICRFTAKSLYVEGATSAPQVALIREIRDLLDQYSVAFQLRPKQLLIVDQRIACHGRMPLTDGQAEIPPEQRRLLMQIFMRE